jgi:hypothetical protein
VAAAEAAAALAGVSAQHALAVQAPGINARGVAEAVVEAAGAAAGSLGGGRPSDNGCANFQVLFNKQYAVFFSHIE